MDSTRRSFLKILGVTAAGLTVRPSADAWALGAKPRGAAPLDNALVGKRWAMVIDLQKLTDKVRKDAVEACNRAHNIPHYENHDDEIKWIWEEGYHNAFPGQHNHHLPVELTRDPLLVLCNHCENPPCVRVCPTKATFQREDGIVMMDYHRCIGCRFCMAGCPYGSRSFNFWDPRKQPPLVNEKGEFDPPSPDYPTRMRGVVEKCNFCAERLAKGKLPACVEASNGALLFGDLADHESEVAKALRSRYSIRRKPDLGTEPQVYYLI
ncbi:MAG: 4Fe-4S dicluster domain-containing protein [Deltaproteobacteria bacterium]|nr:4Fe-4S dicluster domain-containing protein [Deltaproteobacteria bacterium]